MILTEQVYAQALLLAGGLEKQQEELLKVLVTGTCSSLAARLRQGLTPDDCRADFIAAASLYALSALAEVKDAADDVTETNDEDGVACYLERYLLDTSGL